MGRGGAGRGQGRKPVAVEEKTREVCKAAITGLHGSIEEGVKKLLQSGEPALIKFVYEHALGKPTDEVDVTSNGETLNQAQEIVIKDYSKKG